MAYDFNFQTNRNNRGIWSTLVSLTQSYKYKALSWNSSYYSIMFRKIHLFDEHGGAVSDIMFLGTIDFWVFQHHILYHRQPSQGWADPNSSSSSWYLQSILTFAENDVRFVVPWFTVSVTTPSTNGIQVLKKPFSMKEYSVDQFEFGRLFFHLVKSMRDQVGYFAFLLFFFVCFMAYQPLMI